MKEERRNEIAYHLVVMGKRNEDYFFNHLKSLKSRAKEEVKKEEFQEIGITADDYINFEKEIALDIFQSRLNMELDVERMDEKLRNKIAYQSYLMEIGLNIKRRDAEDIKKWTEKTAKAEDLLEIEVSATELLEIEKKGEFDAYKKLFTS
jgi:hypothetical protein